MPVKKGKTMQNDYLLKIGEKGAQRLNLLNTIHGQHSEAFLLRVGLTEGMTVLDMGCGNGKMTEWISQQVGKTGQVYAVDASAAQIEQINQCSSLNNVTGIAQNIYDLDLGQIKFDLIYCRYFLLHLVHPLQGIEILKRYLKPGGWFAFEEAMISSAFCYPYSTAYAKSRTLIKQLAQKKDLNFELGGQLVKMMHSLNMQAIDIEFVQPILKTPLERSINTMMLEECRQHYVDHDLISAQELNDIIAELEHIAEDPAYLIAFPRTSQVSAQNDA